MRVSNLVFGSEKVACTERCEMFTQFTDGNGSKSSFDAAGERKQGKGRKEISSGSKLIYVFGHQQYGLSKSADGSFSSLLSVVFYVF